jgi:hypothetical protein
MLNLLKVLVFLSSVCYLKTFVIDQRKLYDRIDPKLLLPDGLKIFDTDDLNYQHPEVQAGLIEGGL